MHCTVCGTFWRDLGGGGGRGRRGGCSHNGIGAHKRQRTPNPVRRPSLLSGLFSYWSLCVCVRGTHELLRSPSLWAGPLEQPALRCGHLIMPVYIDLNTVKCGHLIRPVYIDLTTVKCGHLIRPVYIDLTTVKCGHLIRPVYIDLTTVKCGHLIRPVYIDLTTVQSPLLGVYSYIQNKKK